MRCSRRRRREVALKVVERDVVTDHVHGCVDAEVESAGCASLTTCEFGAVDNLLWYSVDEMHRAESEELVGIESVCCDSILTQVKVELERDAAIA